MTYIFFRCSHKSALILVIYIIIHAHICSSSFCVVVNLSWTFPFLSYTGSCITFCQGVAGQTPKDIKVNFIPNESSSKTEFRSIIGTSQNDNRLQNYGKFQNFRNTGWHKSHYSEEKKLNISAKFSSNALIFLLLIKACLYVILMRLILANIVLTEIFRFFLRYSNFQTTLYL